MLVSYTYPKLLPQFKADWLTTLRSGIVSQATGTLAHYLQLDNGTWKVDGYCCLGVACVLDGSPPAHDALAQVLSGFGSATNRSQGITLPPSVAARIWASPAIYVESHVEMSFDTEDDETIHGKRVENEVTNIAPSDPEILAADVPELLSRLTNFIPVDFIPISAFNDGGFTFSEIADLIERFF